MRASFRASAAASVTATALFAACLGARAEPVEDFYRGKSISLVVSSAPGGGYDTVSRVVAKYLGRYIPGNPAIVVRNMPGAGGVVATNHLYAVASKDGLTIGQLQATLPFEPLLGNKEAVYDSSKFNWLGSPSFETGLLVIWNKSAPGTIAEARTREVSVGVPGLNSTPSFNTRLLVETLGLKLRMVLGYPGQNEIFLAMERGEVDGFSTFYSSIMATRPNWIAEGKVKMIVQYGPEREPAIKDVPFAEDLVKNDPEKLQLLRAAAAPLSLGRPFAAPPGVPPERVAALRKAMAATFADAAFLADMRALNLPVNFPRSGEQLQATMDEVWHMDDAAEERLRKLSGM